MFLDSFCENLNLINSILDDNNLTTMRRSTQINDAEISDPSGLQGSRVYDSYECTNDK